MALRNIVTEGDEILRKHCREVTEVNERIKTTMEDMLEDHESRDGSRNSSPSGGNNAQNVHCRT